MGLDSVILGFGLEDLRLNLVVWADLGWFEAGFWFAAGLG